MAIYKEKDTGKLFEIDVERMKKEEAYMRSCRLPVVIDKEDCFLFNSEWKDNGVGYFIVARKYLKEIVPTKD